MNNKESLEDLIPEAKPENWLIYNGVLVTLVASVLLIYDVTLVESFVSLAVTPLVTLPVLAGYSRF